MKTIASIVFAGLLVAATLYLQLGGFLIAYGIVPNILLIALIALVVRGVRWTPLICALLGLAAYTFFFVPFWIPGVIALMCCVLLASALPSHFSGNTTADFLILLLGSTLLMHVATALFRFSTFSLSSLIGDVVYTVCLGAVVWFITIRYGKKPYSV